MQSTGVMMGHLSKQHGRHSETESTHGFLAVECVAEVCITVQYVTHKVIQSEL
jgi:hypothetical protein